MRTIESVAKEIRERQLHFDSLCGYDPGQPVGLIHPSLARYDSPVRCTTGAVWHLKAGSPPEHMMLQSCDRHFAMCAKLIRDGGLEPSIHEYGSACGLPNTFWLDDYNACAGQEAMFELGLLRKVESAIESEHDHRRCVCPCPTCQTWIHLASECGLAIDALGYTHHQYIAMAMGERTN